LSGYHLWLSHEPEVFEVIAELQNLDGISEVVFCGFGEPLIRWREVVEVAKYLKSRGMKTRINTNGQADLFADEDIIPYLAPYIDTINISLNEVTAEEYNKICNPVYGERAYFAMLDFAKRASKQISRVILSIVDVIGEEKIKEAERIAEEIGVKLRVRNYCAG
jgi:TatD family-associated radical SAM protein